jgi:hypothetical protein
MFGEHHCDIAIAQPEWAVSIEKLLARNAGRYPMRASSFQASRVRLAKYTPGDLPDFQSMAGTSRGVLRLLIDGERLPGFQL